MTEQKSTQLSPEEWKQLCVVNAQQLLNFLNSVPAQGRVSEQDETIVPGMTPEAMEQIETHVARGKQFLLAWMRSRPVGFVQPQQLRNSPEQVDPDKANGVVPAPKRRGRPRKNPEQVAQH